MISSLPKYSRLCPRSPKDMRAWHFSSLSLVVLFFFNACYSKSKGVPSLTITRIASELKEIDRQGISLEVPFNSTKDECGVRLSPLKNNLLEWHFSFTGVEGSNYDGGIYHGRIRLHPDYPRKAPSICVLSPTGRWEIGKDICLSASAHHQECWNPDWNLRTLVMSLRGFMLTQPREIGSIFTDANYQKSLARNSRAFQCPSCRVLHNRLRPARMPKLQVDLSLHSGLSNNTFDQSFMNDLEQLSAETYLKTLRIRKTIGPSSKYPSSSGKGKKVASSGHGQQSRGARLKTASRQASDSLIRKIRTLGVLFLAICALQWWQANMLLAA